MKRILLSSLLLAAFTVEAQQVMTPELLWKLKHVGADGLSGDHRTLFYSSTTPDVQTEKSTTYHYALSLTNGSRYKLPGDKNIVQQDATAWYAVDGDKLYSSKDEGKSWMVIYDGMDGANDIRVSPDGQYVAFSKEVLIKTVLGTDKYPDLPKTTAKIYTDLNYRHWDTWEDGKFSHIFIARTQVGETAKDVMPDEPYDCPQKPFGGTEDFVWSPDSKGVLYVCKKKFGKEYAQSTNTDLYRFTLSNGRTENFTAGLMGYDTNPVFSPDGKRIAWLSMKHDGFEADKVDIMVMNTDFQHIWRMNLTENWDGIAGGICWDKGGDKIFFNAPYRGTEQLFSVDVPNRLERGAKDMLRMTSSVQLLTRGIFDINGITGQAANGNLIVTRCDMNHAAELYSVNPNTGDMHALTHENDDTYANLSMSETKLRMIKTTDGKMMGAWVIYPPNFDPHKKYPTLLYCQGGPQSALSQFYSFRWNFQLIAAQGYIIVAPNRRGMPGWGVKWNADISKDWGGQPMQDYLSAIDDVSAEPYVDKDRLGCVGASYGGYSVYMLAGMHNNRFKTFIAHDGLFDLKSWYGTTEELWFANWDIGGPYWKKDPSKSYEQYNPSNFVNKWNTPIMIVQGGIDFRVPVEQGEEAFQAAQLQGIKSKLLYLPNENHWVLHPQNAMVWQREFFSWLDETLKK